MNKKALTILGIVLLLLLGMYLVTPSGFEVAQDDSQRLLFRDVSVDAIAKVELKQGEQSVLVDGSSGQWVVPVKDGFRANATKVKSTILKVIDLSVSQLVTQNDANYAALGVADDSFKGGRTRLALLDKDGKELAALLVGEFRKKKSDASVLAPQGQYIRRAGEKSVYMVADPIALSGNTIDWVDTVVSNVLQSQIVSIEEVGAGDAAVILTKTQEASSGNPATFSLKGQGAAESLVDHKVSQLASGLENLRFNDVIKASDDRAKDLKFGVVTTYHLINGLNYIAETAEKDDKSYLRLRVVFDEQRAKAIKESAAASSSSSASSLSTSTSENAATAASSAASQTAPTVFVSSADEASKLSANYAPWVYELPKYLAQKLRMPRTELVQKKDAAGSDKK